MRRKMAIQGRQTNRNMTGAQGKKGAHLNTPSKVSSAKDVTNGVAALQLEETKTKSKNIDVLEEFRKSNAKNAANFVVIGTV
jgi:elongation factor 1 alpha-like protein